jgi:predicted nuclease of restriction endonuclease-like (RecB) superfamily
MINNINDITIKNKKELFTKISELIKTTKIKIISNINLAMVYTYYKIGKIIVEEEQNGKDKAKYGEMLIKNVSKYLTKNFGKGFSEVNLKQMRQFYLTYSNKKQISQALPDQLELDISSNNNQIQQAMPVEFSLSWTHYIILLKIENPDERKFYEIETINNNWSTRELERQHHSSLYERLALSKDKNKIIELSKKGQILEQPNDIIKSPFVLEFLGLEEKSSYSENDLENAIITKLQSFLLELGKGFLFEARQKRFSFDNQNFYVDLVFYNRILKCYVLMDLKIGKITHQDLGQMQMYVNYFDRYVKRNEENKTIGILLCKEKSDALVELTLPKDSNVLASEYKLYLPDKKLLQKKLKEFYETAQNSLETQSNLSAEKNNTKQIKNVNNINNNRNNNKTNKLTKTSILVKLDNRGKRK